jgi:drug/metabolite transporter (DMT)-like permease
LTGVLLALGAGVGFGCSNVVGRMAMARSSVFHTAFWSVAVPTAVLALPVAVLATGRRLGGISGEALAFFMLAGVLADFAARSMLFSASARIGASRASAFRVLAPIVTLAFGVIVFGDTIGWPVAVGLVLMLGGLTMLNLDAVGADPVVPAGASPPSRGALTPAQQGIVFGVVAAFAFGSGDLSRKAAIDAGGGALLGAFVTATTAMALHVVRGVVTGQVRPMLSPGRSALPLLAATGLCILVALLCFLLSLQWLSAGVAATVSGTQVLFAILFARLLNQRVERVTRRVVAGGVVLFAGFLVILSTAS